MGHYRDDNHSEDASHFILYNFKPLKAGVQIAGLALIPFTGGLSMGMTAAGVGMGIAGAGIATGSDMYKNKKHRKGSTGLTNNFFNNNYLSV